MIINFKYYLQQLDRHEKFIHGIVATIIIYISLGALLDASTRPYHAIVQGSTSLLSLLFFLYYIKSKNISFLVYSISITLFIEFDILLILDNFAFFSYLFPIILPLGVFFTLPLKNALILNTIHYIILLAISFYGYFILNIHSTIFDPKAITVFIFAALFLMSFGVFYHLSIEASYKKLQKANNQKAFLLKEVHHRVKNNLNIIASMLGLQGLESKSAEVKHIFEENRQRIEAIAIVHEMLYQQENYDSISFSKYIDQLAIHLLPLSHRNIQFHKEIKDVSFSIQKMQQLSIILNELIVNSIKYAFPSSIAEPHISIALTKEKNSFHLTYRDNGVGYSQQDFKNNSSIGSEIIMLAAQQLQAKSSTTHTNTFNYTLRFPHDT
ncbi:MAG: hypothetical protein DRQ78_07095 [Epsilonproteobacteria bacterium]|nr:MAG: hypothetical protein DRQ78_07095 [Campylobacterota bacterium]